MSLFREASRGLRVLFRKTQVERELDDEMHHYLEMSSRAHERAGMTPEAAARAARIEFGSMDDAKETVRDGGWEVRVETLARDIRYALRSLRRSPAFTVVAVATLALGIGATTAMFSVVNAVLLRPLPYREAGRLTLIWTDDTRRGLHQENTAFRTIADWRTDNRTFQDIAFFSAGRVTIGSGDTRERSRRAFVSVNILSVVGVTPMLGRSLTQDDWDSRASVAVISHALWQRHFASDSSVIGKPLLYEDGSKGAAASYVVVGVMPPGFYFPDKQTELWAPASTYWRWSRESSERAPDWARRWTAIGRLKAGVSVEAARADLATVGGRIALGFQTNIPDFPGFGVNVVRIIDNIAGAQLQRALWLLLGAVSLVLLVACANVASLSLARGAARQSEFAIRRALGAGRGQVARQLLVESLLLALIGGVAGVLLATFATRALGDVAAARLPRIDEIRTDVPVLMFAALVSVATGVIFGLAPAWRMSGTDASEALKEGSGAGGGVRARRTRGMLILAECCLAVILLAGAGLLLRSLERLQSVSPGFDPTHVLAVRVEFPSEARMPTRTFTPDETNDAEQARAAAHANTVEEVSARIAAVPGVRSVGFVDDLFITGQAHASITIPGRETTSLASGQLNSAAVSPSFFDMMGVPLRRGRMLRRADMATKIRALFFQGNTDWTPAQKEARAIHEPVVVNEAFVQRFFPNEDPIGRTFCIDPTNKTYWYEIVGVVGDMHRQGLESSTIPEYFGTLIPMPTSRVDLLVRTQGDPLTMAPTIRQVIRSALPGSLIPSITTADRGLGEFAAQRRFQTWLLTLFAALGLGLAAIGIYGVVHYAVAERTREIGVRIALGASAGSIVSLVIRQGMRVPVAGLLLGLVAAFVGTRAMAHLLYDVGATDPFTFVASALVLVGVAFVACYLPARRAARVDPATALRRE